MARVNATAIARAHHSDEERAAIVAAVCDRIIAGESIAAVFRAPDPGFPNYSTFWRWCAAEESFRKLVSSAEQAACQALADRIVDVSRECRPGKITTTSKKDGTKTVTADMVERSRLEVHALQWTLARRMPKLYGDRTILAGDADNPLVVDDPKSALLRGLVPHPGPTGAGETDS